MSTPLQTSVQIYTNQAYPGNNAAMNVAQSIATYNLTGLSTATVDFGDAVFFDGQGGVRQALAGDTIANFAGFVYHDGFQENQAFGGFTYAPGSSVQVVELGWIFATCVTTLAYTDTIYVIIQGAANQIGKLTNTDSSGNTVALTNIVSLRQASTVAGGIVKVKITNPN